MAIINGTSGNDVLVGTVGNDTIDGGDGNDTLSGLAGEDILIGGLGNDSLDGGLDDDDISGGEGDDVITYAYGDGSDTITGGAGDDSLSITLDDGVVSQTNNLSVSFGGGNANFAFGGAGAAVVSVNGVEDISIDADDDGGSITIAGALAGAGIETVAITGSDASDIINANAMSSTATSLDIDGGAGSDTLTGGAGNDIVDGGTGVDTASYAATTLGVNVDLDAGTATGPQIGSDTLIGIENVTGGSGADVLIGDANANTLTGNAGADVLDGGAGNDSLIGGLGNDTIVASVGDDVAMGGAGTDTYDASWTTAGVTVDLGAGTASGTEIGSDGLSSLENATGGAGDDVLSGGSGANMLSGGAGNDSLDGGAGNDDLEGGAGDDTLVASAGDDEMDGGDDTDTYDASATTAGVTVDLGAGTANGSEIGSDTLGNIENVTGGAGNDTLSGDSGVNALSGGAGEDVVSGGAGDDVLSGGAGNDLLDGGDDYDVADYSGTNSGDATIVFNGGTGRFEVTIGGETDEVENVETLHFDDVDVQLLGGGSEFTIQEAIFNATAGDTIVLGEGVFDQDLSQIVVDRDINLVGQGTGSTTVEAGFSTGTSGEARGWFLVDPGVELNVSGITFDGAGELIWQAFRHRGTGTFDNVEFTDIRYQTSGSPYAGTAIAVFGGGVGQDVDVLNSEFSEIGRVGVLYFGADVTGEFSGNTYTGKGSGDHLDYALDISAGATIDVTGNLVSNNEGVASSDGSTSAAFLTSTFFGGGTSATFAGNTLTDNTTGIFVGFDANDTSSVTIDPGNTVSGGDTGLVVVGDGTVTTPENLGGPNGTIDWNGGAGDNVIGGAALADELSGGAGNDTISGGGGNDALDGGAGNDIVDGGSGDDAITYAIGDGEDAIDGGEGGEVLGDTLTLDLDDGIGVSTTSLIGTVSGSSLELDFQNGEVATATNVENLVIDADADGSTVTLSGDLAATGVSDDTVTFNGGPGDDVFDGSGVTSTTTLDLSGNDGLDTLTGGAGNDLIDGGDGNDLLSGNAGDDALTGGSGDDTITGGSGVDAIDGGSDDASSGTLGDVAIYSDTLTSADFGFIGGQWQVVSAADGTELLTEIETVQDDAGAGASVLLVGGGGFATIQEAVDAAAAGDTILVAPGSYDEHVTIDAAISIEGVSGIAGDVLVASISIDGASVPSASDTVGIANLTLDPTLSNAADRGIQFGGSFASGPDQLGTLAIDNVANAVDGSDDGYAVNAIYVNGGGTDFSVSISNSNFAGNGHSASSGGSGDILFFEFTGNASLDTVSVDGATGGAGADNGIQIAGFEDQPGSGSEVASNEIGTVTFSDVSVEGVYDTTLVYIHGYNDLGGLTFSGTTIGSPGSTAGFSGLYIDPGLGSPAGFPPTDGSTSIDLTGITFAGGTFGNFGISATATAFVNGSFTNDDIVGSSGADVVSSLTGDDTVALGGGDDLFLNGPDPLTAGDNTVDGGLDDDVVALFNVDAGLAPSATAVTFDVTAPGTDTIDIGNGTDDVLIEMSDSGSSADYGSVTADNVEDLAITLGAAGDTVNIVGDFSDTALDASTIAVDGGAGNDTVDASGLTSSHAVVFGGAGGNDAFLSGAGDDAFDGGVDTDLYDASATTAGVVVDLGAGTASGAEIGSDTLANVEDATGGSGADALTGDGGANALAGGAGNDALSGAGGNDALLGESGDDTLDGGAGDDSVDGGSGNDTLIASAGNDALEGGADTDLYDASATTAGVVVDLGAGTASGAEIGDDTLTNVEDATGGSGADVLTGDSVANTLTGGAGNDTLDGGAGNDTLFGGAGNDVITDGAGIDDVFAEGGDDVVNGALDAIEDDYDGGDDIDTIRYASATAAVSIDLTGGGLPFGTASGAQIGSDRLFNFENLQGGSGNDTLTGDANDNVFFASLGNDVIDGNGGNDTYDSSAAVAGVTINLSSGTVSGFGSDTLTEVENATGGSGADNIVGSSVANVLVGNAGQDALAGGDGDDTLFGGNDNDTLIGGDGSDTAIFRGNLADYTIGAGTITDNVGGRDGTDTFSGVEFLQFADQTVNLVPVPMPGDDLAATGPSGNQAVDVLANDTASDGSTPLTPGDLTAPTEVTVAPTNGLALVLDDGRILYVGNDGYSGADSFEYTITTAEGSASAEVDMVVQAPGGLAETSFSNGDGDDEVLTGTAANNILFAAGGNDDLYTLVGNDTANAGDGDDLLIADGGGNQLTGGLGADLFVLTHESNDINDFEIITDLDQGDGDMVLVAVEGLTQADGSIEASRIGLISFGGGAGSLLVADLDDNGATGTSGFEAVLARLDGVDSTVDPETVLAAILANDLFVS